MSYIVLIILRSLDPDCVFIVYVIYVIMLGIIFVGTIFKIDCLWWNHRFIYGGMSTVFLIITICL